MLVETLPHARIYFHAPERVVEVEWTDFVSGADFRRIVLRTLEVATVRKARLWLSNDEKLRPVRAADRQWMLEYALPRMVSHGFEKLAGVWSRDAMAQLAVGEFTAQLGQHPAPLRLFADRPTAWAWLVE